MSKLTNPIKDAVSLALEKALGSPEKGSEVIEVLVTSLAMAISVHCKGKPKLMGEMLEGTSAYLFERAGDFQKLGAFVAQGRK